jgi:hypothetical protein
MTENKNKLEVVSANFTLDGIEAEIRDKYDGAIYSVNLKPKGGADDYSRC